MSAELYPASGNDARLQGSTMGGSKPLHRFMKGQPKIAGIVVLVLGSSSFIVSVTLMAKPVDILIHPIICLGILFIISGIIYIVTEHNPTKKTVTISLAFGIVTLLGVLWFILYCLPSIVYSSYEFTAENTTEIEEGPWLHEAMELSLEVVWLSHSICGAIIFIVMTTLAGAALRSSKNQAIVMMTITATETPVELQVEEEVKNIQQREEM